MVFLPIALAACLAIQAASDSIAAGDLASSSPAFATLPPDTVVGWAPAPGVTRTLAAAELRRLAARLGAAGTPDADLCVERRVVPLDPVRLREALQAQLPDAKIEILDFSRQAVPEGPLEFPLSGLRRAARAGTGPAQWSGFVRYAGHRRFTVWAKVRVRVMAPVVIAAEDLQARHPIEAAQLRLETREAFPAEGLVRTIEAAVARLPRHTIRAGAVLPIEELDPAPAVTRGDTVKVEVWSGATHLELEGLAEGAAAVGQSVAIRNPVSKRRFLARVEGQGRASVGREKHP